MTGAPAHRAPEVRILHKLIDGLLQVITIVLLLSLALLVVLAVVFRYSGNSLVFYDEVASVLLAWLTYYGAALAASRRAHLGMDAGLRAMPPGLRRWAFVISELLVIGFFALVGWYGWLVLEFMVGEALISLPWVPMVLVQSVIPIGAGLFIAAQLISLPQAWRDLAAGRSADDRELADALESLETKR